MSDSKCEKQPMTASECGQLEAKGCCKATCETAQKMGIGLSDVMAIVGLIEHYGPSVVSLAEQIWNDFKNKK